MSRVFLAPGYYADPSSGRPIASGYIYVGEPDTDPTVVGNQKQISVLQEDTTTVDVDQPLRTSAGGVPVYDGSPVTILVTGAYSMTVLDSSSVQKYYIPDSSGSDFVSDTAFGASWDGVTTIAPSKNAIYDKLIAMISDTAYGASWNTVTTIAASKNAIYDQMELRAPKANPTFTTKITTPNIVIDDGGNIGSASDVDAIAISASGEVTMNAQPAFQVGKSAVQSNIVEGSPVTITLDTEVFDIGSNFATNTFTAPITGSYQFSYVIDARQIDIDASLLGISLVTSNRTYSRIIAPPSFAVDPSAFALTFSILADMDASDTALLQINITGGANQTDIETNTLFSGFLMG